MLEMILSRMHPLELYQDLVSAFVSLSIAVANSISFLAVIFYFHVLSFPYLLSGLLIP